ncbi:hypothetical protein HPP92_028277 [Vanilla planifolia]|uniref:Pectinesterase n=1 Tax=Vanilla planifolia TaxID=51239 RepID=A0A835P672_VANPL|nr:hypothetical protein HPP92_028277 [Vanilla planifolia]
MAAKLWPGVAGIRPPSSVKANSAALEPEKDSVRWRMPPEKHMDPYVENDILVVRSSNAWLPTMYVLRSTGPNKPKQIRIESMVCKSVTAYVKLFEAVKPAFDRRRKAIRRGSVIAVSFTILFIVVVAAVLGISRHRSEDDDGSKRTATALSTTLKAVCSATLYPSTCEATLKPMVNTPRKFDPFNLYRLSLQTAIHELSTASNRINSLEPERNSTAQSISMQALDSCRELIGLAIDHLNDSFLSAPSSGVLSSSSIADDLRSWTSAAITYQQTCADEFDDFAASQPIKDKIAGVLKNSNELASNSLAIFKQVHGLLAGTARKRRGLAEDDGCGFPVWVSPKDRKLLQSSSDPRTKADAVVAKDGSGRFWTIKAALEAVPEKSKKRIVIYVKKGVYYENVRVEKNKWNVMIVGDGMGSTVVSGKLNVVDGTPTFKTATFAVFGKGFIGRDMTFRNTAGAAKHQAVALMSSSDLSVFYRCRFDAYQDTLYTHSMRQFYRECEIYGTVDFIFGNAAAVLQRCTILPRRPLQGQKNTITAQGKVDPNQNTGTSIHDCTVKPLGDLSGVRVYLGRPWKPYSTTVFMRSSLGSLVDPTGWLPWTGNSAPDSIFYSEYQNSGPGASTKKRVNWKGLRRMDARQANGFTAGSFLGADYWIPSTGVPFNSGL